MTAFILPDDQRWRIVKGEALATLMAFPDGSVDAVITDPPYSSGGFSRDDKSRTPDEKYTQSGFAHRFPDFSGDSRDQRSYLQWSALWIDQAVRVLKPGGYFMVFTDWRQLPVMTDAVQIGGVFWRGLVVWDKTPGSRAPHTGYFKHQSEYVVWGSKGKISPCAFGGPFNGVITESVKQSDKHHLTGKPTAVMAHLMQPVQNGGIVLDPFMGSGSTGVAALLSGRRFVGIEREQAYFDISSNRLAAAEAGFNKPRGVTEIQEALAL
jgi:site-specific DNA-methyltransferase (adenine-specific)